MDWSKYYPILGNYKEKIDTKKYRKIIEDTLKDIQAKYELNNQDSVLVLKDILYNVYLEKKKIEKGKKIK